MLSMQQDNLDSFNMYSPICIIEKGHHSDQNDLSSREVAEIIAREFAITGFGRLVTPPYGSPN